MKTRIQGFSFGTTGLTSDDCCILQYSSMWGVPSAFRFPEGRLVVTPNRQMGSLSGAQEQEATFILSYSACQWGGPSCLLPWLLFESITSYKQIQYWILWKEDEEVILVLVVGEPEKPPRRAVPAGTRTNYILPGVVGVVAVAVQ